MTQNINMRDVTSLCKCPTFSFFEPFLVLQINCSSLMLFFKKGKLSRQDRQSEESIPDRLSVAILEGAGVQMENSDPRLARLISLAGQKFLTDILTDAMLHWRLANGQSTGLLNHPSVPIGQTSNPPPTNVATTQVNNPSQSIPQSPSSGKHGTNKFPTDRRATLTLEDLIASLNDRGIHVAKPPYYR
ncbi:hypothetical protein MN116_002300 [Schistosoma mekongi]|uniref:Transcription initiation factor TFIID subunit 10 n=1 Tax=Schistosoma mekongi TaxID=38744 RepID=A0AAE2D8A3_SCHME|nr:hypothetical protein MN116_002300 [Schistosoma mekongi]